MPITILAPTNITSASSTGMVIGSSPTTDYMVIRCSVANAHATNVQYAALLEVNAVPAVGALANLPLLQITPIGAGSTAIMDFGVNGYHSNAGVCVVGLSSLNPPTYCASDMSFNAWVSALSPTGA